MDTAGMVLNQRHAGTAFMGMAYGETSCGQSAGWDSDKAGTFFEDAVGGFSTWPSRARGLSVQLRRQIRVAGLHGIHTQTAMGSMSNQGQGDPGAYGSSDWVVAGFETDVWRNFPRGLLSMAHRRRVDHTSRLTNDVSVRPGPLGPAVVGLSIEDADQRRTWTRDVLGAIYGDELTTLLGLVLSEQCANAIQGQACGFAEACDMVLQAMDIAAEARARFELLLDGGGSQHLGFHRQVIRAMRAASAPEVSPSVVLHQILCEGRASDTAGAAAGAILGARFGGEWYDASGLLAVDRLQAYQASLAEGTAPPESLETLFASESELTRRERAFRDEMLAERRTARRDDSVA